MIYRLMGDSNRIRQVIEEYRLRIEEEHSSTKIDVEVKENEADEVAEFAESLGLDWEAVT